MWNNSCGVSCGAPVKPPARSLHAEQISRVKQAADHKGAEKEHEAAPEATELPAEPVNAAGIVWETFRHSLYFRFQLLDVANVTTIRLYSKEKRIIRLLYHTNLILYRTHSLSYRKIR